METLLLALLVGLLYVSAFRFDRGFRQPMSNVRVMAQKDVNMPALSSTMKEGRIVSWNKKVGDKVSAGEVLLVVESDKADMDVESFEDGYLAAIMTPEGGVAAVGAVVATLVDSAAEIGKVGTSSLVAATSSPAPTAAVAAPVASTPSGPKPDFDQILMPALSSTMKEGKVVSWSKKIGDKVSAGDMVLVVESDKADMDVESYDEGYLASILVGDGAVAPVGAPVGYLAKTKEDISAVQAYVAGGGGVNAPAVAPATPSESHVASSVTPSPTASATIVNDGRIAASGYAKQVAKDQGVDLRTVSASRPDNFITADDVNKAIASGTAATAAHVPAPGVINASPMARKLAAENNLDVTKIAGTGNFGRVTQEDVLRAAGKLPAPKPVVASVAPPAGKQSAPTAAAPGVVSPTVLDGVVPMSGMQKAVAKNMEKTLTVPVFRVAREIATDDFDALYAKLKPKGVTVSAMLAKAVAEVCKKHPIMNAGYVDGGIKYNKDVNVAMAVAIDGGLITPTIVKAQDQDLFSISRTWKDLVDKAKTKRLTPAEYSSGKGFSLKSNYWICFFRVVSYLFSVV